MKVKILSLGLFAALVWGGCGGSDEKPIGPEGGTVAKDGAAIVVPEGALDSEVTLEVQRADSVNGEIDDDKRLAGDPYAFTPHGTQFNKPVEITMPVDNDATGVAKLENESDETWEVVDGVTPSGGEAKFQTTSFSIYVGIKETPPPDPDCPASEPSLGDSCDVDATCEYGETTCSCEFSLWACV